MKPCNVLLHVGGLIAMLLPLSSASGQVSFPGPELLGRPEPYSITINVVANAAIQAYFEYGTKSGGPYLQTSPASGAAGPVSAAANVPLVVVLSGLSPDTQYFYRMVYRGTSTSSWTTRPEYSFHTARVPGDTYTFTVTSDSHINIEFGNPSLFQQTLRNIAGESPDFHLDLGDTFAMDTVTTQAQANSNYLNIRTNYFSLISPSVPIFLALGNHEQEEGWHLGDTGFTVEPPIMSANARNEYFLNPDPLTSSFYTGNVDSSNSAITGSSDHTIQDYYAWTWGDALFVVIDPYWYSTTKPYIGNTGGGESSTPGSGNRWDWTLGLTQYLWLQQTLQNSTAKYKFIFAHQVAGGLNDYGRGGAYAVPYVEWGGNNDDGITWAFNTNRTAVNSLWTVPVHQLLVNNHVTAFFHGHDHEYAHEQRDGVVYQEVPMAADATYGYGFMQYTADGVYTLKVLPNSGHLRVTVDPTNGVTVQYVRASLAAAGGTNGAIADSYNIPAPVAATALTSLTVNPTSVVGGAANSTSTGTVTLNGFAPAGGAFVALTTSNSAAIVPTSGGVTVPYNASSNTFPITSNAVTSPTPVTITASFNGSKTAATLTVNPVPTFTPVRINSGGPVYTDSQKQLWTADIGYTGGSPFTVTNTITNTADPTLYKTSRYGASFSYAISAPAGTYSVRLKFAEPVWSAKGKRVFNVAINGTTVLSQFDIFAAAGAEFKAIDKTFTATSSGTITITFTQGSIGNPLVNAIQVVASP